jgi:NAD(P)H-nitrite reductase
VAIVNRLTVDGRDYFLPEPVTELKNQILKAIQAGGGYVNIPPLRGGPGIDILFSPGMPVTWSQIDVGDSPVPSSESDAHSETPDEFGI